MRVSGRVRDLHPSPTLALDQKAKELARSGRSIVNLTIGEPDFPTPMRIIEAAVASIKKGATKYTATNGIPELREAIATKVNLEYRREYGASEVIVTCGAKHALFNLFLATLNQGDEVILFSPYWVSYPDLVAFAGGRVKIIPTEAAEGFIPSGERLKQALTPHTKMIILNSPCNPTGAVFRKGFFEELTHIVADRPDIWIVTDDIYEKLVYDDCDFCSVGMETNLPTEQLVIVSGVSKSYAMTGWRIGWAVGPRELIEGMTTLQSQSTSNPSAVSQWAALEAITGSQDEIHAMRQAFVERRDRVMKEMKSVPHLLVNKPHGAFYIFPNLSHYLGKKTPSGTRIVSDVDLALYLLEDHGVAVVPGSAFGAPGHLRLSYAASVELLVEGVSRLRTGVLSLTRGTP